MVREAVAVHQDNGDGVDTARAGGGETCGGLCFVEGFDDLAVRAYALVHLQHFGIERRGFGDGAGEELRAGLIADGERIGETACDREQRRLALAFEERVGGDGGAHLHRRDACIGRMTEQAGDAFDRRVGVLLRVFGKQLGGFQSAFRRARDDIGERAAAIDPELPALRHAAGLQDAAADRKTDRGENQHEDVEVSAAVAVRQDADARAERRDRQGQPVDDADERKQPDDADDQRDKADQDGDEVQHCGFQCIV